MQQPIHPSINHDGLAYVYHVFSQGSISEAAKHLQLDFKTVSRGVDAFEADIGKTLFKRTRGGCTPLPLTEMLVKALAAPAVEGLACFRQQIIGEKRPVVIIGTSSIPSYLLPVMQMLAAAHPHLMLRHVFAPRHELEKMLERREIHIALLSLEHPLAEREWRTLLRRPVVFLVPIERGIKDAETVWRELACRERLVCATKGAAVRSGLDADGIRRGKPWLVTDSTEVTAAIASLTAAYRCIGAGIGVSQELEAFGLVALPIETIPPVFIGAKHITPLPPHVAPVIESLVDVAAKFQLLGSFAPPVAPPCAAKPESKDRRRVRCSKHF